jgi:hypothetical protein
MEREKMERLRGEELARRSQLLENVFVTWSQNEGTIPLSMVGILPGVAIVKCVCE